MRVLRFIGAAAVFLLLCTRAHAEPPTTEVDIWGGGYRPIFGFGKTLVGWTADFGDATRVEVYAQGVTGATCDIGTLSAGSCVTTAAAAWATNSEARAQQQHSSGLHLNTWTANSRHYRIDSNGTGAWVYLTDRTALFVPPPQLQHPRRPICPQDGAYFCGGSPIVIPLKKSGTYKLSAPEVPFDINGDGVAERVSWPEKPEELAFLALDRNGDGVINSGKELFGNHTIEGAYEGFSALLKLMQAEGPSATLGLLEAPHPLYARLLLWRDYNRDGISQPAELSPASTVLTAISSGFTMSDEVDKEGNQFRWRGWAIFREDQQLPKLKGTKEDGTEVELPQPPITRPIYDVVLATAN